MKATLGFFFDAEKVGNWNWKDFLNGDIGMSGTDGQLLLLVKDLSAVYPVYFFTNREDKNFENFQTIKINDLEEAAIRAKELHLSLFIFNNRNDKNTVDGIKQLTVLKQPFIMWDQNGPGPLLNDVLTHNRYLKRIVCVSKNQANSHRHKKYFSKITFIYNGVRHESFNNCTKKDDDFIHLAYMGAVGETKGFQWVSKAWPAIRRNFPNAKLTVIGSIKTHDRTRQTGDLGIAAPEFEATYIRPYLGATKDELEANGVKFTGHISPNEINRELQDVQLGIVNPNTRGYNTETFCVSAIDFQKRNIPVIGGKAGGLKETVSNAKTGVLINQSNKLAPAIINILSNEKQLALLSKNCSEWIEKKFSRESVVMDWQRLITEVLSNKQNKMIKINMKDISLKSLVKEIVRIKNNLTNDIQ